MRLRRERPFEDLVERQLALFASDEHELLQEAVDAEEAWRCAEREHAEEAYGDYQLVVDALADRLLDLRDAYAAALEPETAETYRAAFGRGVRARFGRYASVLADLDDVG